MSEPIIIYYDNISNIQLAKNPVAHAHTKHIEVHYHFVHERVLSGEVELTHVSTYRQIADIFTKPLGLDKLRYFSGELGMRHLDTPNLRGRKDQEEECPPKELAEKCTLCGGHHGGRDAESDEEFDFDFRPAEEAEGSKDRNFTEKPKITEEGGDEANKGQKTKDELETTNSVEREIESDMFDSIGMFDSDTQNQLRAKRRKGPKNRRRIRDNQFGRERN